MQQVYHMRPQAVMAMPMQPGQARVVVNPDSSRRLLQQAMPCQQIALQVPAGINTVPSIPANQVAMQGPMAYTHPAPATSATVAGYAAPPHMTAVRAMPGPAPGARSYVPPPQAGPAPSQQTLLGTLTSLPRFAGAPPTTYGVASHVAQPVNNLLRTVQHAGMMQAAPCPTHARRVPVAVPVEVMQIGAPMKYVPPHCPNRVPTISGIEHLEPETVRDLIDEAGVLVVDLRGDDRSAGTIEGTLNMPATEMFQRLNDLVQQWSDKSLVCFLCQYSAHRAPACANWYKDKADPKQRVAILEGGFRGWEARGLPVGSLATEQAAQAADDLAMQIGTDFVKRHRTAVQETPVAQQQGSYVPKPQVPAQQGSYVPQPQAMVPGPLVTVQGADGSLRQVHSYIPAPVSQQTQAANSHSQSTRPYVPPDTPNRVPTVAGVEHFDPRAVQQLVANSQCVLVDLRGEDRAAGLIDGAIHVPAIDSVPFTMKIPNLVQQWANQPLVIFTCQYSAHRAPQCANWYRAQTSRQQRVGILSGGFRGWESLGLPVQSLAQSTEAAEAADQTAMTLGTQFVQQAQQQPQIAQEQAASPQPQQQAHQAAGVQQAWAKPKYIPPHLPHTVPTIKAVEHLDPEAVHDLLRRNACVLIDLRAADRSAGLIEGALHEPVEPSTPFTMKVPKLVERLRQEPLVVFTCQYSAHRAPQCANWYREATDKKQRVAILRGGFRGWEASGLPVQSLAEGEAARKADEVAVKLGTNFVQGCLAGVPGGGFCLPGTVPQQQQGQAQAAAANAPAAASIPCAVPVVEDVENIDPAAVHDLLQKRKCLLVDVRGDDRACGLIEGAVHEPAIGTSPFPSRVPNLVQRWADQSLVVFTCQYSAHRAPQCANWYRQVASPKQRVGILRGGFRQWEAMGLPVQAVTTLDSQQQAAADQAALRAGAQITVAGAPVPVSAAPGGGFTVQPMTTAAAA
eukprot:TRINITY_DN43750_c0_g1_i1.p1 TRINITY_DN43750_c0_g1~~TRINITY_DN43750_c0_g1_i1.p1  ORF type:complete len:962 (+),score=158.70 TRINITY_DN43750_c0_g1_i1:75-2960(+)